MNFDGKVQVTKAGRTTGTTTGYLADNSLSVQINKTFTPNKSFYFVNCYAINDKTTEKAFFEPGDSGSGVYVLENGDTLKPLGIAFGTLYSCTAVCKINKVVENLDIAIVRYHEKKKKLTSLQTANINGDEPMDCT